MRRDANAIIGKVSDAFRGIPRRPRNNAFCLAKARQARVEYGLEDLKSAKGHSNPEETAQTPLYSPPEIRGQTAAIKDNFVTSEFPTTCASNMLQDLQGPPSTVTQMLRRAGVEMIAKTNMDEFGMGSNSTNSAFGPVKNAAYRDQEYSAGGSSGGSAIAVAHGAVDFALGSDTGGSVRLPAAYTQTIGFKPSYGRISRNGLIPYANSLDTVGIIARSCTEIQSVFKLLDYPDAKDPTCLSATTRIRIKEAARKRAVHKAKIHTGEPIRLRSPNTVRGSRIGVPMEYNIKEMHPIVRRSWMQSLAQFKAHGHEIVPISLPTTMHALSAYYILAPAEASSNLAKYDGVRYGAPRDPSIPDDDGGTLYAHHRGQLFGDEVKRRVLLGSYALSADAIDNYFIKAQKIRRLVQHDFNLVFRMPNPLLPHTKIFPDGVDYIVCPTAPTPPPLLKELADADPLESYMNDVFTVPASLAGLPAISVPSPAMLGEEAGLETLKAPSGPERAVGIQIIGQFGDDEELLRFAGRECSRFNVNTSAFGRDGSAGRMRIT